MFSAIFHTNLESFCCESLNNLSIVKAFLHGRGERERERERKVFYSTAMSLAKIR